MASRQRRHPLTVSPPRGSPTRGQDRHDYSIDEEAGKGKKPRHDMLQQIYAPLRRFCLNPHSSLTTAARTVCSRSALTTPRSPRGQKPVVKSLLFLLFVCIMISWLRQGHRHPLRHDSDRSLDSTPIMIKLFDSSGGSSDVGGYAASKQFHSVSSFETLEHSTRPDHGGLVVKIGRNASDFQRRIASDDYMVYEQYRKGILFPTRKEKHTDTYFQHPEDTLSLECQRQNWQGLYFPNCNDFHEFVLGRAYDPRAGHAANILGYYDSYHISHGSFRDAWVLGRHVAGNKTEGSVLKSLRIKREFTIEQMKAQQRDAIVMERLTSSPRIMDIYGFCGTSTIVEPMRYEVEENVVPGTGMAKQRHLDRFDDIHPMNNYTIAEKLQIALEMAESLADLHGYEGGVIVHDDVQLCQWLEHTNGHLKLGDFNRAEMMEWNVTSNSYCKYDNGAVYGNYRAPEEMRDDWLDEKIDVFSFGNNIYGLLTGLWVFYENDDDGVVQDKVIAGKRAYIDDRYRNHSYIEGKLVGLMERCWIEDPSERVDIFEAVRFLRQVKEESKKRTG